MAGSQCLTLVDTGSDRVIARDVRLAHTHWTRLKGLLGTSSLPEGQGLWIKPCNQIHMFFMKYAIDVLFLDDSLRVVACVESQPVGSISKRYSEASSVVELPVGTIERAAIQAGAQLAFRPTI